MKAKNNILLFLFSFIFILLLIEVILRFSGVYKDLTKTKLQPSISVFERPENTKIDFFHPDLKNYHSIYYDHDGVKNHNGKFTKDKKKIIGFFGDSFTENVGVKQKYDLVNILDKKSKKYNFVNYGIEGFSIDQAFLRYFKYKEHDIDTVIYICHTEDFPRYEIIKNIKTNGDFSLNPYEYSLMKKIIGKLNITYLVLDAYYSLKIILSNESNDDENNDLKFKLNSFLSKSIISEILQKTNPKNLSKAKKIELQKKFIEVLILFNKQVTKEGRKFLVVVYPSEKNIKLFDNKKIKDLKIYFLDKNILEKNYKFKNPDGHWNEYGNLEVSRQISLILSKENGVNFEEEYFDKMKIGIDKIYK